MTPEAVIEQYAAAGFAYGRRDCCLFVADVMAAAGHQDYARNFRNTYDTEFGARRIVARFGGLAGLLNSILGASVPVWSVKKWNPVLLVPGCCDVDAVGEMVGIFDGDQIVYLLGDGVARSSITFGARCWNV